MIALLAAAADIAVADEPVHPGGAVPPQDAPAELSPPPETIVPLEQLEGSRVAGDKHILPDAAMKAEIQRSGKEQIIGSFRLCLSAEGEIASIRMMKSTGFPAYDSEIEHEMGTWRYRPYTIGGKAVPVCTTATFIYSQRSLGSSASSAEPRKTPRSRTTTGWIKVPYGEIAEVRTHGTDDLEPDATTKAELARSGRRALGMVRMCLDDQGAVAAALTVRETGFPAYDKKLRREIRAWRFRPEVVQARPQRVCSDLSISYPPLTVEPAPPDVTIDSISVPATPAAPPTDDVAGKPAPASPPRGARFLMRGVADFGGEELATVEGSDGSSFTLEGGKGLTLALGFLYQSVNLWALEATIGYKFSGKEASNGRIEFTRIPLDLVASFALEGHRLGIGLTVHVSPTFTCDRRICGVPVDVELDTTPGFIAQYAYGLRRRIGGAEFGVRYTRIRYAVMADSFDGSSLGFFIGTLL